MIHFISRDRMPNFLLGGRIILGGCPDDLKIENFQIPASLVHSNQIFSLILMSWTSRKWFSSIFWSLQEMIRKSWIQNFIIFWENEKQFFGRFCMHLRLKILTQIATSPIFIKVRGWLPERTMESLCANGGWGGPPKLFLSSSFFLSFFFLSGQVMVLVSSGFVHGMSPMGVPRWARWCWWWNPE